MGVNARIGPSTNLDIIRSVPSGTEVTSINTGKYYIGGISWDRVALNDGTQAFISSEYLK